MAHNTTSNPDAAPNLVSSWIDTEINSGKTIAEALRELNIDCDTNYRQSIIRAWERGEKAPGRTVYTYLLRRVLPSILKKNGVRAKAINTLISEITLLEP